MKKIYFFFFSLFYIANFSQTIDAEIYEINQNTGVNPQYLQKYNDQLLFWSGDLWSYNFTTKKSTLIKKIFPYTPQFSSDVQFTLFQNKVYFLVDVSSKTQLWTTDGTETGTKQIFEFPDDYVMQITADENKILITERNNIYISDGTSAGTKLLKQMEGQTLESKAFKFNSHFMYAAKNANYSNELWITNSIDETTTKIKIAGTENPLYIHTTLKCFNLNGTILFGARNASGTQTGLWSLDLATKTAKFIYTTRGDLSSGEILNNKLVFMGNTIENGSNLFVTDGTPENTKVLSSTMHFASSNQYELGLQKLGNSIYFFPYSQERNRLWKTDGTVSGTEQTNVIIPNDFSANMLRYFPINEMILIENSGHTTFYLMDLFENLILLGENRLHNSIEIAGKMIFPYENQKYGKELFQYHLETKEVSLFKDTMHEQGSKPINAVATADHGLIFTAFDQYYNNQFYKIAKKGDQPEAVKISNSIYTNVPEGELFRVGNSYYITPNSYSSQIVKTNGTEAGTKKMTLPQNTEVSANSKFGNLNDESLITTTYYNAGDGSKIRVFKNDINSDTLELLKEVPGRSSPRTKSILYNNSLYFMISNDIYKEEIWKTDGSAEGTVIAFNIPDEEYYNNATQILGVFDHQLLIAKNYRLFKYNSSTQVVTEIPFPANDWGYGQWNVSQEIIEVDDKLYLLSQNGYGTIYKFDNLQTPPTEILSSNYMGVFANFNKCGSTLYFGTSNYEGKSNNLWSININNNSYKEISINANTPAISNLTCINNYLYFTKENSSKIWRTNGTAESTITIPVNVVNEEQIADTDQILKLVNLENTLYFVANTKTSGEELYAVTTELPIYLNTGNVKSDAQKLKLILFPNPASSFIKIKETGNLKVENYTIFDFSGRLISSGKYTNENQMIDISQLNAENYLIEITTKNGTQFSQQFIKK